MPVQLEHDIAGSYDTSKSSTIISSLSSLLCCRRGCGCCSNNNNEMMDGDTIRRCCVLLLMAAGISMSVIVALSCEFFSYQTLDGEPWPNLTPPFNVLTSAGVGLFSYTVQSSMVTGNGMTFETCTPYGDEFLDQEEQNSNSSSFFVAAQYCAIMAPVAAVLALLSHVSEIVCCRIKGSYHINAFLLISATILQGATFLIFADGTFCFDAASQNQCRLGSGAWFSFGAIVSYLVVVLVATSLLDYPSQGSCGYCFELTQLKATRDNRRRRRTHGDDDIETGRSRKVGDESDSSEEEPSTGGSSDTSDTEKVQNYESEKNNVATTNEAGDKVVDGERQNSAMGSPRNGGTSMENDVTVPTHSIDAKGGEYHHEDDDMIIAGAQSSSITMRPVSPSTHHRSSGGFFDMCCAGDTVPAPKVEESG
mmetsp:Transcript_61606/g.150815  ORF Transcript_61606/g.150815 Transcript_61606/m.150815 type:complete len:422 (+) Transcript_61606:307-1572(+)